MNRQKTQFWFSIAIATLFVSSVGLRFWGLGRFNKFVFDEVYFVKYAKNYLDRSSFFDVHPPLGKYLIAISIWISNFFPHANSQVSAFDYRWLNAFIGSLIPLIIAGIAYQLSRRFSYAFLAALFAAADGLLLVESRYAFLNIFLIFFGLLGQWCFLLALNNQAYLRWLYFAFASIFLGASASVKWYGLGFLLGVYLVLISAWVTKYIQVFLKSSLTQNNKSNSFFGQHLTQIKLLPIIIFLSLISIVTYCLVWIPHLQLYPTKSFWELHQQSWQFHQQLGNNSKIHPYCSTWYSWVLMIRPVAYLYETSGNSPQSKIVYDVHGIGNPILWWLGAIAIFILIIICLQKLVTQQIDNSQFWIPFYLLLNYSANWLPWMMVTRCAFLYYYMGASIFTFMAIAYLVEGFLSTNHPGWRAIGITLIFAILIGFAYWLPIYLGLPLSNLEFHRRMWLRSWY